MLADKTLYIARHAETVFNRAGRLQGNTQHTPLTANGMRQAQAMAQQLKNLLGTQPEIAFWCSPTGRTRQTASAIADALELDYFSIEFDDRLREIDVGDWVDSRYSDLEHRHGTILDRSRRLFVQRPRNGEWYDDMAARLTSWAAEVGQSENAVHLAISHGLASRVLRGALLERDWHADIAAMVAPDVPQGGLVRLQSGAEQVILPAGSPQSDAGGL